HLGAKRRVPADDGAAVLGFGQIDVGAVVTDRHTFQQDVAEPASRHRLDDLFAVPDPPGPEDPDLSDAVGVLGRALQLERPQRRPRGPGRTVAQQRVNSVRRCRRGRCHVDVLYGHGGPPSSVPNGTTTICDVSNAGPSGRAGLLAAAVEYVATHGIGERSLRQIAAALGTSHRMLIYHFGSKEGLLVEVVREVERRQRELLAALGEQAELSPRE